MLYKICINIFNNSLMFSLEEWGYICTGRLYTSLRSEEMYTANTLLPPPPPPVIYRYRQWSLHYDVRVHWTGAHLPLIMLIKVVFFTRLCLSFNILAYKGWIKLLNYVTFLSLNDAHLSNMNELIWHIFVKHTKQSSYNKHTTKFHSPHRLQTSPLS